MICECGHEKEKHCNCMIEYKTLDVNEHCTGNDWNCPCRGFVEARK